MPGASSGQLSRSLSLIDNTTAGNRSSLSVVVVGRNEGARLTRCLNSVHAMAMPTRRIDVDSASTDDSIRRAKAAGVSVLELRKDRLSAARARNAGWRIAKSDIILFVDADTELLPEFARDAINYFENDPSTAVVFGHRRERDPHASIYTRVLDLDWIAPTGLVDFCGGNALVRRSVLEELGGFDENLFAGEEPELCCRMRSRGWKIRYLDLMMATHDFGITRLNQYWRRAVRTGYAYAEVSRRFSNTDFPLWSKEARRNRINLALMLGLIASATGMAMHFRSLLPLLCALCVAAALTARTIFRNRWKTRNLFTLILYAVHSHLQQLPIFCGQMRYWWRRRRHLASSPIEYKDSIFS